MYELKSVGKDGEEKYFRKPWAMTTLMFLGKGHWAPPGSKLGFPRTLTDSLTHSPPRRSVCACAGMSFCLPLAYYQERQARKARRESGVEDPLLEVCVGGGDGGGGGGGGGEGGLCRGVERAGLKAGWCVCAVMENAVTHKFLQHMPPPRSHLRL